MLRNKSSFLLFVQFIVLNVILFYLCKVVFPIDFAAFDTLAGGFDTGILWVAAQVAFVVLLFIKAPSAGRHVYIHLPVALFAMFSLAIHGFSSMGLWCFGVLCLFTHFIWFTQACIARHKPWLLLVLVPANFLATIALYVDYVHYSLTREHFNLFYLRILRAVGGNFWQAIMNTGITPLMALLPFIGGALFLALLYPLLRYGAALELPGRRLPAFVCSLLFLPVYFQFSLLLPYIPVSEYLEFKVRNYSFPLPASAEFESVIRRELAGTLANVKLPAAKFLQQADYAWLPQNRQRNVVFLIIESLRQDFLQNSMPETMKLARDGILCLNHLSNSNETDGAMIALYYGTLPFIVGRSNYDSVASNWVDFMKKSGYEFLRLNCSQGNLFYPEYRYTNFREYFRANNMALPAATTIEENSRLICDAVIHKLKNADKKCIIEASLFHTHYKYWYPPEFERHTPVLGDNSEILSLPFAAVAERLANRYRNSILFTDHLISAFIERLKSEGLFDDTLLVIVGDHGEMLGEDGKLFHANGSEILQYHTPFILLGRDIPNVSVSKITSHVDVIPTLGGQMGFSVSGGYGRDVLGAVERGAVTFDIAGKDRLIYRDIGASSLFNWSESIEWVLISDGHFRFDEVFEQQFLPENLSDTVAIAREHSRKLLRMIQKRDELD
ncbi:MAG: hypothetical protein CVV41_19020 [Candidatus Riflebacteria bacterium HGW-Riflebacteria-1]|jgi:hypothetical protein|nr:MAG: hypothetical protein CVV41_19020 [Candidatus Riflebacteria bacterium HGW-Riflebacteria-1]